MDFSKIPGGTVLCTEIRVLHFPHSSVHMSLNTNLQKNLGGHGGVGSQEALGLSFLSDLLCDLGQVSSFCPLVSSS